MEDVGETCKCYRALPRLDLSGLVPPCSGEPRRGPNCCHRHNGTASTGQGTRDTAQRSPPLTAIPPAKPTPSIQSLIPNLVRCSPTRPPRRGEPRTAPSALPTAKVATTHLPSTPCEFAGGAQGFGHQATDLHLGSSVLADNTCRATTRYARDRCYRPSPAPSPSPPGTGVSLIPGCETWLNFGRVWPCLGTASGPRGYRPGRRPR